MTTREITFFFNKEPGTLNPRFLDAWPALMRADQNDLSNAVSTIFGSLVQNTEAKYRTILPNLSAFSITLLNPFSDKPSLKIESTEMTIHFTNVKAETAALFLNSISISPPPISAEEKARLKAEKLHRELLEDNPHEASTEVAAAPKPIAPTTSVKKPLSEDEMFTAVFMNMNECFANTLITLPNQTQQNFGVYIMSRLFIQATSYSYDDQTNEFKMTFESERTFNLTNLPENISAESREGLKQLQNSVLKLSKEIKGKFNQDHSISFEPGALTIEWPKSWTSFVTAQLLGMYESQGDTVTLQIKYGITTIFTSPLAQDFVAFVDSNLPK